MPKQNQWNTTVLTMNFKETGGRKALPYKMPLTPALSPEAGRGGTYYSLIRFSRFLR